MHRERARFVATAALVLALSAACAGSPEQAVTPDSSSSPTESRTQLRDPSEQPRTASPAPVDTGTASPTSPAAPDPVAPTPRPEPQIDPLDARMQAMTLRDRARQLLVVGFSGTTAPVRLVDSLHPGGLIYFEPNVASSSQIRTMSRAAQRASRAAGQPLLIMTDQEGGPVTRLPGTSDIPAGSEFGADADWARRTARNTGRSLVDVGINVDLAPVADVNTVGSGGVIGSRSFSSAPAVVSRLVSAQVCGYHEGGVAAAAKHFPGHGSTSTDSHLRTATIQASPPRWRSSDLPPFAAAVDSDVDLIMVGHLALPAIDPSGRPATISRLLTQQLLRQRLGFEGVIITDALNMGGITSWGSSRSIAVQAIQSGVDLLLMPPQPREAAVAIVQAVRDGRISESRLNASVERVLRLKQELGLFDGPKRLGTC
jgi:beta-N-acetylhexosaminidase